MSAMTVQISNFYNNINKFNDIKFNSGKIKGECKCKLV